MVTLMLRFFLVFVLSSFLLPVHAQDPLARNKAMFPRALVAPPIPVAGYDGKLFIPGWTKTEREDAFYTTGEGEATGFLQVIRQNDGFTIDSFFDHVVKASGLTDVLRPAGQQAEAFRATYGPMVAAVFGQGKFEGTPVSLFIDLHGPDDTGQIIGTMIYAPKDVFDSWDAVLLPLVRNGYVEDPSIFENRNVMRRGTDIQKTALYVGMINRKIMADFGSYVSLSEGAMQAARNAATIAACAGADNCNVTYDGSGNAVAEFDTE